MRANALRSSAAWLVDHLPVEHDAAAGRRLQADDRERDRRLAAAGFADEAEALAALQLEIDAVDRAQHGARRRTGRRRAGNARRDRERAGWCRRCAYRDQP